jgi:hydroxyethylthiazole kinase-like uncharacterized protein yjeF
MRLVTAAEMKELERIAIEDYGLPSLVLMENAGRHVAEVVRQVLGDVRDKTVTIFIGKGNNGGDGLVAARHLVNMGAEVKLLALADMEDFSENAAVNLDIWHKMGQKVYSLLHGDGINIARLILMNTDLIVDAVYGTGFKGKVGEKAGRIFEALNGSGKPIVAVDIPSGLEADSGKVSDSCIQAGHTVTFGLPKLGLLLEPGADYVGNLHVVDISIPAGLVEKYGPQRYLTTPHLVRGWLPNRESAAHKGDFGRVLVVAGSRGMTGAASLCGEAVIRAGAGLVTVAVPETLHDIMEAKLTEVMTASLPDSDKGRLARGAKQRILTLLDGMDALAIGPGLSTDPEVVALIKELLPGVKVPCVLDADALNALAGDTDVLRKMQAPVVVTPHPGEMARLMGTSTREIQRDRLAVATSAAADWNVVVLLKGARTIVATPNGAVYINPSGNPGMATAGSGDVLTGVVAALIGQGLEVSQAAAAGAYIHGLAGDIAARRRGMMAMVAGDILAALPEASLEVSQNRD